MTSTSDATIPNDPDPDVMRSETARPDGAPPTDALLSTVTAFAVVVGVVLRFVPRSGMWLDEALTANISGLPIGEIWGALRRDGHPPLFYVMTNLWGSLGGDSDWWLRALPGVISVLTLPVTYLAGRRLAARAGASDLGARRTGLIALALMAVMPFGIRYGAELRMYSLVVLLVGVGYLLVDELLGGWRGTQLRRLAPVAAGTAVVAAALLWTHYWSMWLLAAVGLLAAWRAWTEPVPERRAGARVLVGALVLGGLLFLPWAPNLLYQSAHTGTPWGELFGPASVVVITIVDFAGARFGFAHLLSYGLVTLIVLAAVAVIGPGRRIEVGGRIVPRIRTELIVLSLTLAIGWATSFTSGNTFSSRYSAVVYPLFVLAIAAGIAVLRDRVATSAVLAAIVVACTWGSLALVTFERSQTDLIVERMRDDVATHGAADPVVVITCPDQLGVATQRQADRIMEQPVDVIPYPDAGDPRFIDWVDYGDRNLASDPAVFLDGLGDRVPEGATVYLVANFTYRTFEGKCEQLLGLLTEQRDAVALVERKDDRHDEVANLWALRPRA